MIEQIKTSYTVLEVREQKHSDIAPIVLICETLCSPAQRRRIEIRNNRGEPEIYDTAKLLIKGDIITVEETVIGNVKKDNGMCIRQLHTLRTEFVKENV